MLTSQEESGSIPADLLGGNHSASSVYLSCADFKFRLQVDPAAFRSSSAALAHFAISNCDLTNLELQFLTGFTKLSHISIHASKNIHLSGLGTTLPANLPRLSSILIANTSGLIELMPLPHLKDGLDSFSLADHHDQVVDDFAASRLLDWLLFKSSKRLSRLTLSAGELSRIPEQVPLFTNLDRLDLSNNSIPMAVPALSLSFAVPVKAIDLSGSKIHSIAPGAFRGIFFLRQMNETYFIPRFIFERRFQSSKSGSKKQRIDPFRPTGFPGDASTNDVIIQRGSTTPPKYNLICLFLYFIFYFWTVADPIDCTIDPCHLAWLIRNSDLLKPIKGAMCSDGITALSDLDDIECPYTDDITLF